MSPRGRECRDQGWDDELRRYGLERDPREDDARELELADRLAEQASLPPGDAGARALARLLLGRGLKPVERLRRAEPQAELVEREAA